MQFTLSTHKESGEWKTAGAGKKTECRVNYEEK